MTTPQPAALPELPPLPESNHVINIFDGSGILGMGQVDAYTADQMRTYAKQYAQWQSTRLRGGVPGWQWVPVEPTPEMLAAADECWLKWENAHICTEVWPAMLTAAPQAPDAALDAGVVRDARTEFEAMNRDSHGFKRSPRGTYRNPPVARDWKWFQAGIDFAKKGGQR